MSESNSIDRRTFLKTAAGLGMTAAAAASLPGCASKSTTNATAESTVATGDSSNYAWLGTAPTIDASAITDTVESDIVIVGGGNAGTMCATAAAEAGATVSVIESQTKEGLSYYGLHDIANLNSNYLLSHGIASVKVSEFVAEYQRRNRNKTNPLLVKEFAENSGEMLDWIVANAPQEVIDDLVIENAEGSSVGDDYFANGAEINGYKCFRGCVQVNFQDTAPVVIEKAESQGATWYWAHTGIELISESTTEKIKTTVYDDASNTIAEKEVDTPAPR